MHFSLTLIGLVFGVSLWRCSGWIVAFSVVGENVGAGVFVFIIAMLWSLFAVLFFLILVRVSTYWLDFVVKCTPRLRSLNPFLQFP